MNSESLEEKSRSKQVIRELKYDKVFKILNMC